jgi:uncharacterized protein
MEARVRHRPVALQGSARGNEPLAVRWALLLALSLALGGALRALHLPAALLLGPMLAAILLAVRGQALRLPSLPFLLAQGVIGLLIARSIPLSLFGEILRDWPLFFSAVISVIAVSVGLGWLLARWQVLPGSTAVWGSVPGAATAMVLMADAYGADVRLVAFMQYLRMFLVTAVASAVARIWTAHAGTPVADIPWLAPIAWIPFAETLAVIGVGTILPHWLGIPAGALLLPLIGGLALQTSGVIRIELPPWLLAASYALIGWGIGLRFNREVLSHALRALPRISASILVLIALCAGLAALLARFAGIDPLTAYLATSPGGVDAVAIIAIASKVDVPFVMALQTSRFILVLLTGPWLAQFIAARVKSGDAKR